ncbi:hypothetical protein D9M68_986170 [compost metagenome]
MTVRTERFFFEEAADGVVGSEKIIVGVFCLVARGEDRLADAGIEFVDNLLGARAQGGDVVRTLEIGQDDVAVTLILFLLFDR